MFWKRNNKTEGDALNAGTGHDCFIAHINLCKGNKDDQNPDLLAGTEINRVK